MARNRDTLDKMLGNIDSKLCRIIAISNSIPHFELSEEQKEEFIEYHREENPRTLPMVYHKLGMKKEEAEAYEEFGMYEKAGLVYKKIGNVKKAKENFEKALKQYKRKKERTRAAAVSKELRLLKNK